MPVISTIAAATARAFGAFKAAAGGAADEFFNYVTLLLHGDGTNGAQNNTFLDSSTNNFTITRNGNTTQGTFSPFSQDDGKWGAYFDGSGDYLTVADNAALDLETGNFTVEAWIFATSVSPAANFTIVAKGASSATGTWQFDITSSSKLRIQYDSAGEIISTASLVANTWNHVAVVREGTGSNQTKLYINGTNDGTGTVSSNLGDASTVKIGLNRDGTTYFQGYISNLRIVKGTAVYTSNFTPPTTPLTAISGTSLLTCQSNRFKDNSANNFAITVNGNTSIQPFSPFAPSAAYSAATNGGSGYFDGSGDYLTVPHNAAFDFGSGDFTMEAWVYPTTASLTSELFDKRASAANYSQMPQIQITANQPIAYASATGSSWAVSISGSSNVKPYSWNHVALTRSGSTWTLWLNGASIGTATSSITVYASTSSVVIGAADAAGTNPMNGYIAGSRIVKGTAIYTAAFTPPTAPLTAVSGTSLLLNYTNAGIYDATSKNDLETVGNAQISTSVKKFGTGSLAFDGTGDYLVTNAPSSDLFAFGTGNFTVEMWIYFNSLATSVILDWRDASTTAAFPLLVTDSNTILWSHTNNTRITSGTVSTGQWYHLAICRSGTDTKMFLNGTQTGSTYSDSTAYLSTAGAPRVGIDRRASAYYFNGYIDDLRITKGVARYTSNFTPPTAAFPDL